MKDAAIIVGVLVLAVVAYEILKPAPIDNTANQINAIGGLAKTIGGWFSSGSSGRTSIPDATKSDGSAYDYNTSSATSVGDFFD